MGFGFTNKPPATAGGGGDAFKPLPSLPGTIGLSRDIRGPTVSAQNAAHTTARPSISFGVCTTESSASRANGGQDISHSTSDALSFFLNFKVPSKFEVWDLKDDGINKRSPSKSECYCLRTAATRVLYQPSTAAHTVRQYSLREPEFDSTRESPPFRFLDLPGEMRNRIYRAAISPGHISLRSCAKHHMSVGVDPPLVAGILAGSKQLANETKDLVFESTFIVDVSLESPIRSVINPLQVPRSMLDKIQHLVLVLDFTRVDNSCPSGLDWRYIQRMTALSSLKICAIQMWPPAARFTPGMTLQDHHRGTIQTILECIPATCIVQYGWHNKAEEDHVREMHRRITVLPDSHRQSFSRAKITDPAELAAAASMIDKNTRRGCKSGSRVDFRSPK